MCHRALSKSYKLFSRRESSLSTVYMIRMFTVTILYAVFRLHINQTITSIPHSSGDAEDTEDIRYVRVIFAKSLTWFMVARSKIDVSAPIGPYLCRSTLLMRTSWTVLQPQNFFTAAKFLILSFTFRIPSPDYSAHSKSLLQRSVLLKL